MSVWAYAEQNQIDCRRSAVDARAEQATQLGFIGSGSGTEIQCFAVHTMHSLGVDAERGENRLAGHAIVRVGMNGRHGSLVAEQPLDLGPFDLIAERR